MRIGMVTVLFSSQYMLLIRWYDGRQICLGPKPSQNSSLSLIASPQRRATGMGPSTLSCVNYPLLWSATKSHPSTNMSKDLLTWLPTTSSAEDVSQSSSSGSNRMVLSRTSLPELWPTMRCVTVSANSRLTPSLRQSLLVSAPSEPNSVFTLSLSRLGSSSRSSLRLIRTSSTTLLWRTDGLLMSWMTKEKQSWDKWWPPWPQICSL